MTFMRNPLAGRPLSKDQNAEVRHRYLRPHGRVIVSVPNVANITVRLALLLGRFEYRPRGIMDLYSGAVDRIHQGLQHAAQALPAVDAAQVLGR